MKLESVIESLIENETALYNLYHNSSFRVQAFCKKGKRTQNNLEKDTVQSDSIVSCIEFLLKKEQEYLEILDWEKEETLLCACDHLWEYIPIKQDGIIEHYIENESYILPFLRTMQLLVKLVNNKEVVLPFTEEEEEDLDTKVIERQGEKTATKTIIDEIYPELNIQYMVHFLNIAYKHRENYKNPAYENILNQLFLDIMYLSKNIEEVWIGECKKNISYKLFLVEDTYPYYFDTISIGQEAILDDVVERLKKQLIFLSSKKRARTPKVIFLRCLYIEMLCEEMTAIKEDELEDFVLDNTDIIASIPEEYTFPILEKLREMYHYEEVYCKKIASFEKVRMAYKNKKK